MNTEEKPRFRVHKAHKELRWWWYYGHDCFHVQLARPQFHMHFGIYPNGEHVIDGDFCGFYWHLDCRKLNKALSMIKEGSFRFYRHEGGLWFSVWGSDWESSWKDPWWREMYHFDFVDFFLGEAKYSKQIGEVFEDVIIPMPEGNFKAKMTYEVCTWKRPRWFAKVRKYTDIELDRKAPRFPGKGENSWDQGDDAIYGMAVEGHSLPKAIGGYVERVMEYRERRSGGRSLLAKVNPQ